MSTTFEVLSDGGRPMVVKRATEADVARLQVEGERLKAASHPGVVQVLASEATAAGWELRLAHGGRALDVLDPLPVGEVAAVVAGLATTLADLHATGIVHGRVDASHVLVGAHGRAVLCGFGPASEGGALEPHDDVAAVGALLVEMLGIEGDGEPIPDRRWWPRRRWTGWERRALLTLADQACAEPPTRRPTARRLAAAICEAVPHAAVGGPAEDRPASSEEAAVGAGADPLDRLRSSAIVGGGRPAPRSRSVVLVAVGIAVLVIGVGRTRSASAPAERDAVESPPALSPSPTLVPPTTLRPTGPASTPCGPVDGVDLDGDGCREAARIDGDIVTVGAHRFRVGLPGDRVAVRDWDCDGASTLALLRPSTGEVFVFTRWDLAADVEVPPVATVPGGEELVPEPGADGCSGLSVRTSTDAVVEIVRTAA